MSDQLAALLGEPSRHDEVFLLYEGGELKEEFRNKLTHVRIARHVTKIPYGAFRGCGKLVEIEFNEGLRSIGSSAFRSCTELRSVTLPSSVIELRGGAFAGCSSLVDLQLKEGLQVISGNAFEGCRSLRSVTLPSTVTELSRLAFYNCIGLIELHLSEGLQIIGEFTFQGCKSLRSVTIPSTVTALGKQAFTGCRSLVELQLNEGLKVIGAYAFSHCLSLRRVTLSSSVAELGKWAFYDCRNMAEMSLNDGLQTIGKRAFDGCLALRSVTVPSTVTELGSCAFQECINLSEVIFLGGKRLLNQEFVACGFEREEQGLLNQEALDEMLFDEDGCGAFDGCPELRSIKISISWAVSERMARLPRECMLSVEERIHNLHRLKLLQDGEVLSCFPVVSQAEGGNDQLKVQDTNVETARSLHKVLQLIAYHELKESSIVIELAIWKSRIDVETSAPRADCRVPIPDTAKSSIMDYCGFAGFLEPAIED